MLVSNLQDFLRSLLPALRALGINTTADGNLTKVIEVTADALAPFEKMGLEQLSELLQLTQQYRETGSLPQSLFEPPGGGRKRGSTTPKVPKPPKSKAPKLSVEAALAKMEELRSRAQFFDLEHIRNEVQALDALLTADDLKKLEEHFLGTAPGKKSKKDRLKSIEDKISGDRDRQLRGQDIQTE